MHILCDISHPAHVHFFRNAIDVWCGQGHEVSIVARDKDITLPLLDDYGYEYSCLSRVRRGLVGLGMELIEHEARLYWQTRRCPPDVLLEVGGTFIVHAAKMLRRPSIVFYDTEHAALSNAITYPFASAICTPACYHGDLGAKQVRYDGYQELAYLHPNWFEPDPSVLTQIGLMPGNAFFVLRFVGWEASHDIAQRGFSSGSKVTLVQELSKHGQVFITSEGPLPPELEQHRLQLPPSKIHHLLAFCTLYVGESATMASECSILGTPAIYVSPVGRGYTDEQEQRYGLCFTFLNQEEEAAIAKALELIQIPRLGDAWQQKRHRLLAEKIDVTAWMVGFVTDFVRPRP
jgi:predicted glycosyltransferase